MWQEDCLTFVPCTLILPHMIRAPKSKLCDYPHPPDLSSRLMYSAVNTEAKGNVLGTSLATREAGLLPQELINKVTLKASQHGVLEDSTLKERIQLDSRSPTFEWRMLYYKWLISMFFFFRHSLNTCISWPKTFKKRNHGQKCLNHDPPLARHSFVQDRHDQKNVLLRKIEFFPDF